MLDTVKECGIVQPQVFIYCTALLRQKSESVISKELLNVSVDCTGSLITVDTEKYLNVSLQSTIAE